MPPTERSGIKHGNAGVAPDWFWDDISSDVGGGTDTEADILRMIKDEIDFELAHGIVSAEDNEEESRGSEGVKAPESGDIDPDEYLLERFGALGGVGLPHVPKSEPRINTRPKPPVTFVELDAWCCRFSHLAPASKDLNSTPWGRYM